MHSKGVYALSEQVTVGTPGDTVTIPLKLRQGMKGPPGLPYAHVSKLWLEFSQVTTEAVSAATALDGPALAGLISTIQLDASSDSPFGKNNGGQIIRPMSGYLALTALAQMTGAPMVNFGGTAAYENLQTAGASSQKGLYGSTAIPYQRRLKGKFVHQGPWRVLNTSEALTNQKITFTLPIGERWGEKSHMNVIPLAYLNGGGGSCDASCPASSQGQIQLTTGTKIGGSTGVTVTSIGSVRVWAEIIFMDSLNAACLQPYVNSYMTTDTTIRLDAMVAGFAALCEDLAADGKIQLTNLTGVTQQILRIGGFSMYDSQYASCRLAYTADNAINGEVNDWADIDPQNLSPFLGSFGLDRYDTPWNQIYNHLGDSASSPTVFNGCVQPVEFELVGSSSAINRRILTGSWFPQNNQYVAAAQGFAGAPIYPGGAKGVNNPEIVAAVPASTIPRAVANSMKLNTGA